MLIAETACKKRICFSIDPRIEVLSIVLKCSGYGELYKGRINDSACSYLQDVEAYFSQYILHETIQAFREFNQTISGDLPVAIVLYTASPPHLTIRTPWDAMIRGRVNDESILARYVGALRQFAMDTHFSQFFQAHESYYAAISAPPEKSVQAGDYIAALEAYFGSQQMAYCVILAPLLKTVAFGPRVVWQNGALETYCVFPAVGLEDERITFKEGKALRNTLIHEFAHSFVNPLVDRSKDALVQFAPQIQEMRYNTKANYGAAWHIGVYEHIVRAVTTRLTCLELGEEAAEKEMAAHEEQGFLHIRALAHKLRQYEASRQVYPRFAEFFPELLRVFTECLQRAADNSIQAANATPTAPA